MKVMQLLYLEIVRAYYRWAMHQIDPMHPDVVLIVVRQQELDADRRRLLD